MRLEIPRQIFEKCFYTKFHKNPSSGSRVISKAMVAFRNYANEPKWFRAADGNGTNFMPSMFFRTPVLQTIYTDIVLIHASDPHLQELVNEVMDSHETWHGCHSTKGIPPIYAVLPSVKSWQTSVNSTLRVMQHSCSLQSTPWTTGNACSNLPWPLILSIVYVHDPYDT